MLKNYQSGDSRGRKSQTDSISWDICSQRKWRRVRKENVTVMLREPVQNPGWCNLEIKSSSKPDPKLSLNYITSKVKVKVTQSCLALCDPLDCIVHGILQARILEWIALPFSRWSSQPMDQTQVSHIAGRFFTSWATTEDPVYVYKRIFSRSSHLKRVVGTGLKRGRSWTAIHLH